MDCLFFYFNSHLTLMKAAEHSLFQFAFNFNESCGTLSFFNSHLTLMKAAEHSLLIDYTSIN